MNKIKKYAKFLENKNINMFNIMEAKKEKPKTYKLKFEDDYSKYKIEYTVLDDEGDEIDVSYSGIYIEKHDREKFEHEVSNIGENEMKTFIEEEIEADLHKKINFKFVNFIYSYDDDFTD